MRNFTFFAFITLLSFTNCNSNDEQLESTYLDNNLKLKIDAYVEDSVDNFSNELEAEGGYFLWKNYRDYLGFGDTGFKERIHNIWSKSFDNETLELYINSKLEKELGVTNFKIEKNYDVIENYSFTLLFPFLQIAIEDLLIGLIVWLIINYIITPYIAKRTLPREYKVNGFWANLGMSILTGAERQNRIDARVRQVRKTTNTLLMISLAVFTFVYYDFNDSLNNTLKNKIKKDVLENIITKNKTI